MENDIDIEALKNSKEFLANLDLLEEEMRSKESIKKGYQLLDSLILIEADEERINDVFTFILNHAFDRLSENLTTKNTFNMREEEDIATVRAIYEHAIQIYSDRSFKSAKELFLVLHHVVDYYKLQESMMIHAVNAMKNIEFDDFIESIVDTKKFDPNVELAHFLLYFTVEPKYYLEHNKKFVDQAKKELRVLKVG